MSEDLTNLGVKAIRDGVAGGDFTAREVAEAFNANVAAAKELNAFIVATPEKALEAADAVDTGEGVVIVTDMFGGSPSNLSLMACRPDNRRILYGANLPMLIKLAKSRHKSVPDAVAHALNAGRKYIDSQNISAEQDL